jgi:predicted DNA binding CopG/RHH family protein
MDGDEQDILNSYDSGEWLPVENRDAEITRYRQYARATLKKDKRVNIRISQSTLDALQAKALEEGIPYQTLIAIILHKYVNGRLIKRQQE